jgi:hypothetical protein
MNKTNNSSTSSSTGYKNRFKKLIDYAQAHTAPIVTKTEVVQLDNYYFKYKEYFETEDGIEWVSSIEASTSRFDNKWSIRVKTDEMLRATKSGEGYEDLIRALGFYMNTPNYGTPEYDNLLVESLTETAEDFKTYETMWD